MAVRIFQTWWRLNATSTLSRLSRHAAMSRSRPGCITAGPRRGRNDSCHCSECEVTIGASSIAIGRDFTPAEHLCGIRRCGAHRGKKRRGNADSNQERRTEREGERVERGRAEEQARHEARQTRGGHAKADAEERHADSFAQNEAEERAARRPAPPRTPKTDGETVDPCTRIGSTPAADRMM